MIAEAGMNDAQESEASPLMCEGPAIHVFLDGKFHCECRAIDYGSLEELWAMIPVFECGA